MHCAFLASSSWIFTDFMPHTNPQIQKFAIAAAVLHSNLEAEPVTGKLIGIDTQHHFLVLKRPKRDKVTLSH